jgi:hypothetical protein
MSLLAQSGRYDAVAIPATSLDGSQCFQQRSHRCIVGLLAAR